MSLPYIKGQVDLMADRMEKEIDRELKLRKDAKQLIINAVRKEPTLDRNVKAWLKTERDNNQPLNEGQVFTHQYRKLLYQEIKKDKDSFPLMNDYMKNGVVKLEENEKNKNILKWAKIKYQMDYVPKQLLATREEGPPKFDYEKIKKVYNASLLDTEL